MRSTCLAGLTVERRTTATVVSASRRLFLLLASRSPPQHEDNRDANQPVHKGRSLIDKQCERVCVVVHEHCDEDRVTDGQRHQNHQHAPKLSAPDFFANRWRICNIAP